MPKIRILYIAWFLVCIFVVLVTLNYKSETAQFYGIAETQEISVSTEGAVEIKKIHVVPGQAVSRGELIAELENPELTRKINDISHEIEETDAEMTSRTSALNYEIKQLQARDAINKELIAALGSLDDRATAGTAASAESPLQIQIEGLRKALELETAPMKIKIDRLQRELRLLVDQKNRLYVFAQAAGIIGAVNFKPGEQTAPFQTIMTLHAKSPSYIRGYVHEFVFASITVGQKVSIISVADPSYRLEGEVVGINSKLTEYPDRLKRIISLQVFGREVQIKIPEKNNLMLGEKVLVKAFGTDQSSIMNLVRDNVSFAQTAPAPDTGTAAVVQDTRKVGDVTTAAGLKGCAPRELSGAVYLKDLGKYLVVSDTTPREQPLLYLMDEQGVVDEEVIIQGLQRIDDMEAVTQDLQGRLYIACSQSSKTHGPPPPQRKLLVRLIRDGAVLRLDKQLSLYDLLSAAAEADPRAEWVRFLTPKKKRRSVKMNIEGIMYLDGDMYLGFKKPLKDSRAVILKIKDIDRAFDEGRLAQGGVALWKQLDLADNATGTPSGISDMLLLDNSVYILGCTKKKAGRELIKAATLWRYDMGSDRLTRLTRFENLKAEGLAWNSDKHEFMIVCDHGSSEPSKIFSVGVPQ